MCRRTRGCSRARTTYPRPDCPSPGYYRYDATSQYTTEPPDFAKSRYEAFCALCGLGLMYRVRCANPVLLGLAISKPLSQPLVPPDMSVGGRMRSNAGQVSSCWSRNAIGVELDLTTHTIGQALQVSVPYVAHSCERSQTIYGNRVESTIAGNFILAGKPTRTVPIPTGFAPNFNWDTGTAPPVAGPSTASATDTAAPAPTQSAEKVTYIIHSRCHEILKLVWERENIPWGLPVENVPVGIQRVATAGFELVQVIPPSLLPGSSGHGEGSTHHLNASQVSLEGQPATGPSSRGADTTTAAATNNSLNPSHLLPALFTALHNLGRTPGKNYWSEKDCQFDSEADFPGLAKSVNAYWRKRAFGDVARGTDLATTPHLGIVSSRNMWPHLNPHVDRDEFCPGIDYTGTALVAVADPIKEIPCLPALVKFTSPLHYSGTQHMWIPPPLPPTPDHDGTSFTSTPSSTSTPRSYPTLPPRTPSPSSFIWSPLQSPPRPPARITPQGPCSATDPFTLLPPELLLQILNYLSLPNISSLRLCSRYIASFIHPTSELPQSYFREAFRPGGEFEFLQGLSVLVPSLAGERARELTVIPEGAGGEGQQRQRVDWKGLYRKVQYLLEVNPEAAGGKFGNWSYVGMGEWVEEEFGRVVVPRSPGLANRRRIWGVAVKVAKEMRRVMVEWGAAREGGEEKVADREV